MRMVFVLAMRVASYRCVTVLKPVHASVVKGAPFNRPSIFSSTNSPSNSGRIIDVPLVVRPARPGWNQNVISTSQVPHIATRRACSGSVSDLSVLDEAGGRALALVVAAIALTTTSAALKQARKQFISKTLPEAYCTAFHNTWSRRRQGRAQ